MYSVWLNFRNNFKEFLWKNYLKLIGVIAILGISFISCNNGLPKDIDTTEYEPLVFIADLEGEPLEITITRPQTPRSTKVIDEVKVGDHYEIIHGNRVISKGIITAAGTYKLK